MGLPRGIAGAQVWLCLATVLGGVHHATLLTSGIAICWPQGTMEDGCKPVQDLALLGFCLGATCKRLHSFNEIHSDQVHAILLSSIMISTSRLKASAFAE